MRRDLSGGVASIVGSSLMRQKGQLALLGFQTGSKLIYKEVVSNVMSVLVSMYVKEYKI